MICDNDRTEDEREARGGMVLATLLAIGVLALLLTGFAILGGCGR